MTIRQLEYFCAVAEEGSVSAAARKLHIAQPPISRQLTLLEDELPDEIELCGVKLKVLATPGHSAGSACLYDPEGNVLFSGDTLFCAGFGRTDLYGGSGVQLRRSLRTLFALPGETRVLPGHGPETTIAAERRRYGL